MSFNKEKIKNAQNAMNEACLHCGSMHSIECPISVARQALKTLEEPNV